jgi:hypothetical protein
MGRNSFTLRNSMRPGQQRRCRDLGLDAVDLGEVVDQAAGRV